MWLSLPVLCWCLQGFAGAEGPAGSVWWVMAKPCRWQFHLPVLLLTLEKPSLSLLCRVWAAGFELRPGKLAVLSLKHWASKRLEEGVNLDSHSPWMYLSFSFGLFFFFPSPEIGISLLTTGFTAGYLDCVPYFSLMKTWTSRLCLLHREPWETGCVCEAVWFAHSIQPFVYSNSSSLSSCCSARFPYHWWVFCINKFLSPLPPIPLPPFCNWWKVFLSALPSPYWFSSPACLTSS